MMSGVDFVGARISKTAGILIGVGLVLAIGLVIFPFRGEDYEFELLLVLPVVCVGVLSGRTAALVTALVAVAMFHYVTRSAFDRSKFDRDVIAFATFLSSALAVGITLGGRTDRLTLAAKREEERRVKELTDQIAAKESRLVLLDRSISSVPRCCDRCRTICARRLATIRPWPRTFVTTTSTTTTRHELLDSVSRRGRALDRLVGNLLT